MKKCFKWLFGNKKIIDCQIDIVSISNIECCEAKMYEFSIWC